MLKPFSAETLNPKLNPVVVASPAQYAELAEFLHTAPVFVLDTETNVSSNLFLRKIRTIQIGNKDKQFIIDLLPIAGSTEALLEQGNVKCPAWAESLANTLRQPLLSKDKLKVGTNLRFDYTVLKHCLGLRMTNVYDCMLAEKVIYAGRVNFFADGFWALDDMVARYCNLQLDKSSQTSFDLETPLSPEQITYAAIDSRIPLAVMAGQASTIKKFNLQEAVRLECACMPAFADMEISGIKLDKSKWIAEIEKVEEKHLSNKQALDGLMVGVVGKKEVPAYDLESLKLAWDSEKDKVLRREKRLAYQAANKEVREALKFNEKCDGEAKINYGSPAQMLKAFHSAGINLPNTNDKTLDKFSGEPLVDSLRSFRETEKLLTTYGRGFLEHVSETTGRVHSVIEQLSASTGRTGSRNPNLQNIPQASKELDLRSCFVAEEGYVIITRDYDGAELRIIADGSQETSWVEAFKNGQDVHSVGAQMMFADEWLKGTESDCKFAAAKKKCNCKVHKHLRNNCKAINFGIAYGMEAKALAARLRITVKEAKDLLTKHKLAFPKVHAYLSELGLQARMLLKAVSPSGRHRLFTKPSWEDAKVKAAEKYTNPTSEEIQKTFTMMWASIEREGKNMPIQGGNADVAKKAMELLWDELESKFHARLILMVHDELVIECPKDLAEECDKFMAECMEKAGTFYIKTIQMTSEGHIDDCWRK